MARARASALRAGATILLLGVFAWGVWLGAILHANLPASRRLLERGANLALRSVAPPGGPLEVRGLTYVGPRGIVLSSAILSLPGGAVTVEVKDIVLHASLGRLLFGFLARTTKGEITIDRIEVGLAEVALSSPPRPGPGASTEGSHAGPRSTGAPSDLRLVIDSVEVRKGRVRGQLEGGPPIDAQFRSLHASVRVDPSFVRVSGSGAAEARRLLDATASVSIQFQGKVDAPLPFGAPLDAKEIRAELSAEGSLGSIEGTARAALAGRKLEATAEFPLVSPSALRELWPEAPLATAAALRGAVEGSLPDLTVRVQASAEAAELAASGKIRVAAPFAADLAVTAADLDLRAFAPSLPRTALEVRGRLRLRGTDLHALAATVGGRVRGRVGNRALPPVEVTGRMDAAGARATLSLGQGDRPRALARLDARRVGGERIRVAFDGHVPSLASFQASFPAGTAVAGTAAFRGEVTLAQEGARERVDGELTVDGSRLRFGPTSLGALRVAIAGEGPIASPRLWFSVRAIAARSGPFFLHDGTVHGGGKTDEVALTFETRGGTLDRADGRATARVRPGALELRHLSAVLHRGGRRVTLALDRMQAAAASTEIRGLVIGGIGANVEVSMLRARGSTLAHLAAPRVELAPVAEFLALPWRAEGIGSIELSIDSNRRRSLVRGSAALAGRTLGLLENVTAAASLEVENGHLEGSARASAPELGSFGIRANGVLAGRSLDRASLRGGRGSVSVSAERITPSGICAIVRCPRRPELDALVGPAQGGMRPRGTPQGVTLEARAVLDRSGSRDHPDTSLQLAAVASEKGGKVASFSLETAFEMERALDLARIPPEAPLLARFDLPPRALRELPAPFRPEGLAAVLEASGTARGTVGHPLFAVHARATHLHATGVAKPVVEIDASGTYDLAVLAGEARVASDGADLARARLTVRGSPEDLLAGGRSPARWSGELEGTAHEMPLGWLPPFVDRAPGARLSGSLSLTDLPRDPHARGHLRFDVVRPGQTPADAFDVDLSANRQRLVVRVDAQRSSPGQEPAGSAALHLNAGVDWMNRVVPRLDPSARFSLVATLVRFPIAAINPFLPGPASRQWGGTIDGNVRAEGRPGKDAGDLVASGGLTVEDGRIFVPVLGRELRRLSAHFVFGEAGKVRIDRASARLGTGTLEGSGAVVLRGAAIERVEGDLSVPRDRPIPLSLAGVPYGTGWGRVRAVAELEDRVVHVHLALPTFQLTLSERDPARVETLDGNDAVKVLQPLGPPARASGPTAELSYVVELELGEQVSLRRGDMRLELTGNPTFYLSEEARASGSLRVTGGYFAVSGKRFVIERGILQFGGSPSDPSLDIEATYRTQDGSRITAHLGGSLKDAHIGLTSDPPRSQSEIVSLLLFGDRVAPGQINIPGAGLTASQATGVADQPSAPGGGALVLGINELLYQSALPVQTQVSSTPYSTRASAAVELGDRVRLEYTRQFGAQVYGQQLDANLVELDWRFAMRWVLRTIIGDRGTTSLDVLWQRWY